MFLNNNISNLKKIDGKCLNFETKDKIYLKFYKDFCYGWNLTVLEIVNWIKIRGGKDIQPLNIINDYKYLKKKPQWDTT